MTGLAFENDREQDLWEHAYVEILAVLARHDEVADPEALAARYADSVVFGSRARLSPERTYASRWQRIVATSPSGKTQWVCGVCGRVSLTPDKHCPKLLRCKDPDCVIACAQVARAGGLPVDLKCRPVFVSK